jgi:chloramphenicol-sensitive protein RarD
MTTTTAPAADKAAAEAKTAIWVGAFCYALWGLIPLFFVAVAKQGVGAYEQTAQRCFWALAFAALLVMATKSAGEVKTALRSKKTFGWLVVSALMISGNWLLFIIASTTGHQLDTSLAYFINPLLNMAVGAMLFREKIPTLGWVAVALAAVGVAVQTVALGSLPLFSLGLALTFLAYGVIRKRAAVSALTGVFVETLILTPFGLAFVFWLASRGEQHFGAGFGPTAMIILLGPATVIPLYMFSWAARRMPLSTLGFLQFIAPSLLFVVALSSGERPQPLTLVSFVFIWAGVALFIYQAWSKGRPKAKPVAPPE